MFWENIKAKGKLRLGAILALCAVVLGCATFAFTSIFGGLPLIKTETVAEAATGDIGKDNVVLTEAEQTAKAAADGTQNKPYIITSSSDWTDIVMASVAKGNGTTVYAKLAANWTASAGNFGAGRGFGWNYSVDDAGCILVPSGANITLDLNGKTIDRKLTTAISNGSVICNRGYFTINDSVGGGKITGGFSSTDDSAGGITIAQGWVTLNNGSICNNKNTVTSTGRNAGGVVSLGTTFTMNGGSVNDNIGYSRGGVDIQSNGTLNFYGGEISNNIAGTGATSAPCGGVRVASGKIQLKGSPIMSGNLTSATVDKNTCAVTPNTGKHSDMTINSNTIFIVGALGANASIGINANNNFTFTSGYGKYNGDGLSTHFFADESNRSIAAVGSGETKELQMVASYNQTQWSTAVQYSIANKVNVKVTLTADWEPTDGNSFGTGWGFGMSYAETSSGNILVPSGANMTIDLNGKKINRKLTSAINNGTVIFVYGGTLEIRDSVGGGQVTGGFLANNGYAGGVSVGNKGKFTLAGGSICGNKQTVGSTDCVSGGVVVHGSTFIMTGGFVENNYGWSRAGIDVQGNGVFYFYGGEVRNNIASSGAGAGYECGGVRSASGYVYLKGSPKMYGNKINATMVQSTCAVTPNTGTNNDIMFNGGKISLTGKLEDAYLGVGCKTDGDYLFTANYGKYNSGDDPAKFFFANAATRGIKAVGTGTATEVYIITATTAASNAAAWSTAVKASLDNDGAQQYVKLSSAWTAASNSFGTGYGFAAITGKGTINDTSGKSDTGTGCITVPKGANIVLDLNGLKIDRGLGTATSANNTGHCFIVAGTLTIVDTSPAGTGTITGGYANQGAAILIRGSTAVCNLVSGTITGNRGTDNGGTIHVYDGATFNMSGGSIENNSGGGGTFNIYSNAKMTMSGGEIKNNTVSGDYVFLVEASSSLTITGGSVTGNTGTGTSRVVLGMSSSTLNISGNPVIWGNKLGTTERDIYIDDNTTQTINIIGQLTSGAKIGVGTSLTVSQPTMFTSGYSLYNTVTPYTYFFSDNETAYKTAARVNIDQDTMEGCFAPKQQVYLSKKPVAASSGTEKVYDGKAVILVTGVNLGYMSLSSGSKLTATAVGTYTTKITPATGCYWPDGTNDEISVTCKITQRDLSTLSTDTLKITVNGTYTYTGSAQIPTLTVTDNGVIADFQSLSTTYDYTLSNKSNTNASDTATVTMTGKGNYKGSRDVTFKIARRSLDDVSASIAAVDYDGTAKTPAPTVTYNSMTLVSGTGKDYTIGTYTDNTNAGTNTGKVTITGIGNYT
ncbi:MAG: right-handed parallel beta-helix repeat-containing protein, partial [Roseburia sp.]|nr:right-handed parallel beta-helix repeat-containing protein [Roseburia sp.]